ncbi:hypothetical protein DIS09_35135 [Burkholderia pseudomallei]|nr:hypothetical protein DIS09_35135 [Burkholderia pseudomallei]
MHALRCLPAKQSGRFFRGARTVRAPVSYTPLTLPTKREGEIPVGPGTFKKKNTTQTNKHNKR